MRGMPKHYQHLNQEERDNLAIWRGQGYSLRTIAQRLHRNPSTVLRELRRNGVSRTTETYIPHIAQERAGQRWRQTHQRERLPDLSLRAYVQDKIRQRWSPELIAGRLK